MIKFPDNKRIVFDIDGTIATALGMYEPEKQLQPYIEDYGATFIEHHTISAMDVPHLIYPGYYALLRWLHQQEWAIDFFSSGVEQRNRELADELMRRCFGTELASISYRVFSHVKYKSLILGRSYTGNSTATLH